MVWMPLDGENTTRYYYYDNGFCLKVKNPIKLSVTNTVRQDNLKGHAHRIETSDGYSYYIPPGWVAVKWKGKYKEYDPIFS